MGYGHVGHFEDLGFYSERGESCLGLEQKRDRIKCFIWGPSGYFAEKSPKEAEVLQSETGEHSRGEKRLGSGR